MSDFDTDLATVFLSAIDNFENTIQSASEAEAKPDFVEAVLKASFKSIEKKAISAIKEETGQDLSPLVDMAHSIYDEIDRANAAAENYSVAQWIRDLRSSVADAYAHAPTGDEMTQQIQAEYNAQDEGRRGGYIGGIENEFEATRSVRIPDEEIVEVALYTAWINESFDGDCMDGTGLIHLQFDDDGTPAAASIKSPLGNRIATGLNSRLAKARLSTLMGPGRRQEGLQGRYLHVL